jgi:iron complex transport system permease protein
VQSAVHPHVASRRVGVPWTLGATGVLVAAVLAGLLIGPVHIGVDAILRSAVGHLPLVHSPSGLDPTEEAIVWQLRFPRVVLAALVGGMLAVAGASYQGVFRNPLADPYLLGVAAGAGLGATFMIAYGPSGAARSYSLPLAAFAGGMAAVAATYAIGRAVGGGQGTTTLILAGVTVAAFVTATQTFIQQQHAESINEIYVWLLGGLATSGWREVALVAPYMGASALVLVLHRRSLDVLGVGEDEARALGIEVVRVRLLIIVAATLGTAAAVAVSGLIGFVGIVVPHLIRLVVASSFRVIVPLSLVVGAAFLVLADVIARTALAPAEVPIGVVTAFVGAPFFALVLRTSRTWSP